MCHKVRWTYYAYTNSGAVLYYEDGKYSKKNDTIYIHSRKEHLDKEKMVKVLEPAFVVSGDSLTSLDWGFVYVKAKTLK